MGLGKLERWGAHDPARSSVVLLAWGVSRPSKINCAFPMSWVLFSDTNPGPSNTCRLVLPLKGLRHEAVLTRLGLPPAWLRVVVGMGSVFFRSDIRTDLEL
jgi:hypothetical protein